MPPEAELIQRYQAERDPQLLDNLMGRHYPAVYRVLLNLVHQEADAADLAQATFLKVLQHGQDFRGQGSFRAYLLQIAVQEARQFWRRGRGPQQSDALFEAWLESRDPEVSERASRREFEQALSRALETFPERLKVPLVLHYYEQLPMAEIASLLDLPKSTVQSRINQAVGRLRRDFESRRLTALLPLLGEVFAGFPAASAGRLFSPGLGWAAALLLGVGLLTWWATDQWSNRGTTAGDPSQVAARHAQQSPPLTQPVGPGPDSGRRVAAAEDKPDQPVRRQVSTQGPGRILGQFLAAADLRPLVGARITVTLGHHHRNDWLSPADPRWFRNTYVSDAQGRFICDALPLGKVYELYLHHPQAGYRQVRGLQFSPHSTQIDLGTLLSGAPRSLRGQVRDHRGRPLAGVEVALGDRRGAPAMLRFDAPTTPLRGARGISDGDGRFELQGISSGWHRLRASHPEFAPLHRAKLWVPEAGSPTDLQLQLSPGADLRARVIDSSSLPVAGCKVVLQILQSDLLGEQGYATWRPGGIEHSDAEGLVRFARLSTAAGFRYSMEAVHPRGSSAQVNGLPGLDQPLVLEIEDQEGLQRGNLSLRGRLVPSQGALFAPGQDAGTGKLELRHDELGHHSIHPDRGGLFAFRNLPAGKFQLRASLPGFVPTTKAIELPRDAEIGDLLLQRGASMHGQLRAAGSQEPLAGVEVWFEGQRVTRSDTEGRYRFSGIAASKHTRLGILQFRRRDFAPLDAAVPPCAADAVIRKDLSLQAYAAVRLLEGRVRDAEGQPLCGVAVRLRYIGSRGQVVQLTFSDPQGRFALPGSSVDSKTWEAVLSLRQAGYAPVAIALTSHNTARLDFTLRPGRSVQGRVRDQHGQPVPHARVAVFVRPANGRIPDPSGGNLACTLSDAQGRFDIHDLPEAALILQAAKPGYRSPPGTRIQDLEAPRQRAAELRLERGHRLDGQLLDPQGHPLAGALLFAEGVRSGGVFSDAKGRFSFPAVFTDQVRLRLRSDEYEVPPEPILSAQTGLRIHARRRSK